MATALRKMIYEWVYHDRIKLGDGQALEPIAPDDLERIRKGFPRTKFFILGHPRSGTSFLARLIRIHPEVHCNWQTQFFGSRGPIPHFTSATFQHWLRNSSNRWVSDWNPTAALLRVCCDVILEREADIVGKSVVGDKSPNGNGAQAVRWLGAVYPDARLLYIIRDGRDTVLSRRIQFFLDQPNGLSPADRRVRQAFLQDPRPFFERQASIFTPEWLRTAARRWSRDVDESIEVGQSLFGERFAVAQYEELLANPEPNLRRLWQVLGVEAGGVELEKDLALELQKNPEADWHGSFGYDFLQKLPRGVHGGWRSLFTPADAELFEQEAHATLEAHGYLKSP